jgi:hypothetical protein
MRVANISPVCGIERRRSFKAARFLAIILGKSKCTFFAFFRSVRCWCWVMTLPISVQKRWMSEGSSGDWRVFGFRVESIVVKGVGTGDSIQDRESESRQSLVVVCTYGASLGRHSVGAGKTVSPWNRRCREERCAAINFDNN